jgi:PAS domain-containing protein
MSFVTTRPQMVTSGPSMSNPQLLAEGVHDYPRDGAGLDGSRRIERRRNGCFSDSPMDILGRLPAVVVLERIPVPSLAMARDGIILFANTAFAQMVGYRQDRLAGLAFPEIFHTVPVALWALSGVDALANLVVQLQHCEGWTVRARMSKSALMRSDDPVVLVTFENLTEQLWMDER